MYISHLKPRMQLKVMGSGHLAASGDLQKMPQILGDRKLLVNLQRIIYQDHLPMPELAYCLGGSGVNHSLYPKNPGKVGWSVTTSSKGSRKDTTCDNSWGSGSWPCLEAWEFAGNCWWVVFWGMGFLAGGSKEPLYNYWAMKTWVNVTECDWDFFNCAG